MQGGVVQSTDISSARARYTHPTRPSVQHLYCSCTARTCAHLYCPKVACHGGGDLEGRKLQAHGGSAKQAEV